MEDIMEGLYEACIEAHAKNLIAKKERLTLRDEEGAPRLLAVGDIPYEAVAIAALNKLTNYEDAEKTGNRNITQNITQLTPEQIQEMYSMLGR